VENNAIILTKNGLTLIKVNFERVFKLRQNHWVIFSSTKYRQNGEITPILEPIPTTFKFTTTTPAL
jgi:hypothetical protein